jgi:cell division transport system permease protein
MGTLFFFFKEAVRGFYQAKLMTFVSIVSIATSLLFITVIAVALLNVNLLLRRGTDQADVAAYIRDDMVHDSNVTAELLRRVRLEPTVRTVVFIDKDSAWKRFSGLYGTDLLEAVDGNPLPASLEIYLNDNARSPAQALKITDLLGRYPEIESVRYSREWIEWVERLRFGFWVAVIVLIVIMNFILYFMISNTIKLTIYARKEIISHMQVVGATASFVKMPFIIEGMLQGFIGGVLCITAGGCLRLLFNSQIAWGMQNVPGWSLPLFILFMGVLYGWMGSAGAVRKFLV